MCYTHRHFHLLGVSMSEIKFSLIESHNSKQLFHLVNDINAYPEFVPNCVRSGILQEKDNNLIAFIEIAKLGFHKRFITKNTLIDERQIDITLVDGPFKHLKGCWKFVPISPSSSRIIFDLHFEFKNKLLEFTFSPIFKEIMLSMVNSFSRRARQVYDDTD